MNWFALSISSVFALAAAELMQQHLLNKKEAFNEKASAVLTVFIQVPATFVIILLTGLLDQLFSIFNMNIFPFILLMSFIAAIANVFYFRSFKVKNISFSAIFVSFSVVVSTFLGIMIFSESTNSAKFLGIILVLGAIVIANFKNAALEKNHLFGLLAGVMFGITYTLDKKILLDIHPLIYIFWAFLLISLWGFVMYSRSVISSMKGKKLSLYKPILFSGAGYFLYNLFAFNAYRAGGEVGRVDAINNSQIFLIILFEYFVLKNTKGTFRKAFSAALAVLGVFILGFA